MTILWLSGDLLAPTAVAPPAELARGVETVARCAPALLGLVASITLVELTRDIWKLWRARRQER